MNQYEAVAQATIPAPPAQVYAIIADYHQGHPAILPPRYFTGLTVTTGGQGAGTTVTVHMNVYGSRAVLTMTVSEPEPGRVLVEEDPAAGVVTTFTVDPVDDGQQARVTIATTARASPGLRGWLEKRLNPAIMRRIYHEELGRLAAVARAQPGPDPARDDM